MEKYIDKLFRILRIKIVAVWLMVAIAVVLGEMNIIPNGVIAPHSGGEFKLNTVVILLTVIGIPLALRLFTLNTTKGLRRMNNEEALKSYHVWSDVRLGILCLTALLGIVAYYLAVSISCVFCALVAMSATLYCWPSKSKIANYLESVNNE